jgi:cytochrome P450
MLLEQEIGSNDCPVDHTAFSQRKSGRATGPAGRSIEQTPHGIWHIYDYDLARMILRGQDTRQAGFSVDLAAQMPGLKQSPVLFQDGPEHRYQRKEIARFFSPTTTRANYQEMMENFSDQIIVELKQRGEVDLSELTMKLAVRVAAEVVGLTNSLLPGMAKRLNRFLRFDPEQAENFSWKPGNLANLFQTNMTMLSFYLLDVKPAIRARRKEAQEDVISHLIEQGYKDTEILIECITYGAAGMITTREFIQMSAWHFIENPELKKIYLDGSIEERHQLLEEILRLEPVVGNLFRRATADIELPVNGRSVTIARDEIVELHVQDINIDQSVVGDDPMAICPGRPLEKRAQPPVMGFGFGHHRCPGAYIAIQETDIFLQRLLVVESLRLVSEPEIKYVDLIKGYEINNFRVSVE